MSVPLEPPSRHLVEPSASAKLRSLVEAIPAVLWTTDLDLRCTSLAGSGLQSIKVRPEEFIGVSVEVLFPCLPYENRSLQAHRNALAGEGCSFECSVQGRELEAHVEPLRGPNGSVVGVIGAALDGTDRMVAGRALRLAQQSYRSLIEGAPYAICRATLSGQILQVNRPMVEMLGYESEAELLVLDLRAEIFSLGAKFDDFRRRLLDKTACRGFESVWRRRDGTELQVRAAGRAVRDKSGEVLYLDILAENVTDQKQLEAQLRQAQKMQSIGQLAGGVAHDFNNLLTVIHGQVEVILRQTPDKDVLQSRLEEVQRAAERASTLTRQLLAFSRRQVLQSKVVDLNQIISRMSEMLSRLITETIELTFIPAPDAAFVLADPTQIEQVLMNLVVNARDAMPYGGKLTIETAAVLLDPISAQHLGAPGPGEYVLITVQDTGHGMDRQTQASIFEPFFTTKGTGEGTGLGLAMVYGVVKQSGGHIRVESEPGLGTTFRIYLPRVAAPERALEEPVSTSSPLGKETILLAEDEDAVRQLVADFLRSLGYHVLTAPDGMVAQQVARSHSGGIDLLISDIVMPNAGGHDLAEELRKGAPHLKVILVSGYAGQSNMGSDVNFVAAHFLQKPFPMQRLAQKVREVLDGAQAN
jgi:two-component system, cell cycle sensor histidine kinase and response regulator CckA